MLMLQGVNITTNTRSNYNKAFQFLCWKVHDTDLFNLFLNIKFVLKSGLYTFVPNEGLEIRSHQK